jgi:hypothetical protein
MIAMESRGSGPQQTPPGWYPDPQGGGQRYWDGYQWTEHTSGVQQMPPQPPHQASGPPPVVGQPAGPPPKKSNTWKWVAGAIAAVVVIAIAASGSDNSTDTSNSGGGSDSAAKKDDAKSKGDERKAKANEDPEKPNNASDDYTPHVKSKESVTVDGIVYSVRSVKERKSIGDPQFGLDEQASGTYLVVDIAAHSTKGETATLSDGTFKVTYDGGPEYSADTDGTVALTLDGGDAGADPFFLTDIQPDGDEGGKVVFDVPDKAVDQKLELRINELGFGTTHGFIRLP